MFYHDFPTSSEDIYERVLNFDPKHYSSSRDCWQGLTRHFSPYIAHGFLTLPMLKNAMLAKYDHKTVYRFLFELAQREYYYKYFEKFGEKGLWESHNSDYFTAISEDVLNLRTGVRALDEAFKTLYEGGFVDFHARKWLAAYINHYTFTDWKIGAKLFFFHLLDGELSFNNLQWREVKGDLKNKPFYFNQENLNKFSMLELQQRGTDLDFSYEEIFEKVFVNGEQLFGKGDRIKVELKSEFDEIKDELTDVEEIESELRFADEMIYIHEWMINEYLIEELNDGEKTIKVLIIDRQFWDEYPASAKRFRFIVDLAKNIEGIRICLGDPITIIKNVLLKRSDSVGQLKIYSQEYFSNRIKQIFTSLYCSANVSLEICKFPWLTENASNSVPK
ncbi:hypothetical protein GF376_02745, partial [Candidatus Peregrinibacteria bacterium]|nr:hypothetical protein [Candidatus Peregrinibacteria bacterium]